MKIKITEKEIVGTIPKCNLSFLAHLAIGHVSFCHG
jgi:hypothetical protein